MLWTTARARAAIALGAPTGFCLLYADALSCSGRCRMAAHRAAHELRDAYREESGGLPGRDGYPDGEAAPVLASPGSHRRQAEGPLSASQTKPSRRSWRRGRVRGNLSSFHRTRAEARIGIAQ